MDVIEEVRGKVDSLLAQVKALSTRQKINLGLIVLAAILIIVSFFFIKSSIGKVTVDRSLIDSLQAERNALREEREALGRQRDSLQLTIDDFQNKDIDLQRSIERQTVFLSSINQKLQSLDNDYKNLSRTADLSRDELKRYFSELR